MEEHPSITMGRTSKIIRRSIYTFLQNYQYFTTTASLLAFPFSVSILLSQALLQSFSFFPIIRHRLLSLFDAAGFPPSLEFFTILNLKLSQTITSTILVLPFTLLFLLLSKASVIQALNHNKPSLQHSFSSFLSLYPSILHTHLCNSLIIISANATCFSLLFFAFNCLQDFGYSSPTSLLSLSAIAAVLYSIVLANALVICNLALVSSVNLAMAAIEALFHYRVVRAYHQAGKPSSFMALEGMFIAYLHSILIVLDTTVSCVFFKSCKMASRVDQKFRYSYQIDIMEEDESTLVNVKTFKELP